MIQPPRRSVTRFFIPLIDVLILLFCIFLFMPLVEESDSEAGEPTAISPGQALELMQEVENLRAENDQLRRTREAPASLRAELERLRREKVQLLQDKLAIRTLMIDPKDGTLYFHDPERVEVRNQADALALIDRDRRAGGGKGELYYLVLYPRDRQSGYPTVEQRARYERWFEGVPLGFDVPGRGPGGDKS